MYKWTIQKDDVWEASFNIGGFVYIISCVKSDDFEHPDNPNTKADWFDLGFTLDSDGFSGTKVINTNGNVFSIFSIVLKAFFEFVYIRRPEFIKLSASKENTNRFKLYNSMVNKFSGKISDMGYVSCVDPNYLYNFDLRKDFDTLAWRKQILTEQFYIENSNCKVYKNPTRSEIISLGRDSTGELRGLLCKDSLYVWDSFRGTHGGICDLLGLKDCYSIMIDLYRGTVKLVNQWKYDIDSFENLKNDNKILMKIEKGNYENII